jgi:hypothetical protein
MNEQQRMQRVFTAWKQMIEQCHLPKESIGWRTAWCELEFAIEGLEEAIKQLDPTVFVEMDAKTLRPIPNRPFAVALGQLLALIVDWPEPLQEIVLRNLSERTVELLIIGIQEAQR